MEAKKKLLTYAGLKALEEELENLKVVKMSSVILRLVSRSWKQFSRTLKSL